jgi:hypothetical protein
VPPTIRQASKSASALLKQVAASLALVEQSKTEDKHAQQANNHQNSRYDGHGMAPGADGATPRDTCNLDLSPPVYVALAGVKITREGKTPQHIDEAALPNNDLIKNHPKNIDRTTQGKSRLALTRLAQTDT